MEFIFLKEGKVKIKKEVLFEALKLVQPGLAKKEIVEQATHFVFTGQELCTFNDHICVIHQFVTDFICSIPADHFYKILDKMPQEDLDIILKDNKIIMKAGKITGGVSTQTGEGLLKRIDLLMDKKTTWQPMTDDIMQGLELCIFSASRDMSDIRLTGIYIDRDAIISSDNLRMSQYFLLKDIKQSFLIPATSVLELLKYKVSRFCIADGWAFFETGDKTLFCCQLIIGMKYPVLDDFFEFEGIKFEMPADLKNVIEKASVISEGETDAEKLIEIKIEQGNITCRGQNELAWLELAMMTDIKLKESIQFSINPFFLMKILDHTRKVRYGQGRILFESDDFLHLIAVKSQ